MIEITISGYKITARGHAGYAPIGQDIVCAAVTILISTMAAVLDNFEHEGKLKKKRIQIESGYALLICEPNEENKAEIDNTYDVIIRGLKLVEMQYPDNVKIFLNGGLES